jgi:hypothetical protein
MFYVIVKRIVCHFCLVEFINMDIDEFYYKVFTNIGTKKIITNNN